MLDLLYKIGPLGFGLLVLLTVVSAIVFIRKYMLVHQVSSSEGRMDIYRKKYKDVDANKIRPLLLQIGLIVSLWVVYTLMEFPSTSKGVFLNIETNQTQVFEELIDIPPTQHTPPPPPKMKAPVILEATSTEEITEELEIELSLEFEEEAKVEEIVRVEESELEVEKEEEVEEIFVIVEESAAPVGGFAAFYTYVSDHVRYPAKARRTKVEGRVYVEFIVNKEGKISNAKIVRGIGGGCDEEALRIIKNAPDWLPGKQRGKKVSQRMTIPIYFKLAK